MRILRAWLFRCRLNRILDDAGWPRTFKFSGSVKILETRYDENARLLDVTDCENFANWYVDNHATK